MKFSPRRSLLAGGTAAVLLLSACGGDDEPVAEPAEAGSDTTTGTTDASSDTTTGGATSVEGGPEATVPADVPEEYIGAIGPVDVIGDPLPYLETDVIADDPAVGEPAPVIVGLDFEGNPVRIDAATDGPTMVVFVAHWCPHCNAEIPVLNELRDDGLIPDGLNVVAVSTAPRADSTNFPPGDWLVDMDWQWPAIADGVDIDTGTFLAAEAYGVSGFPFITLVDGDGNVAARWSGERDADEYTEAFSTHLGLG